MYRWITRRPLTTEPGAVAFGNSSALLPVVWAFVIVSVIEMVAVDFMLARWQTVRAVALFLGGYGLLWMIGLVAALRVHPHVVGESGLRVRSGLGTDILLPWSAIASVQARR